MDCFYVGADKQGQLGDKAAEFKKIFRDEVMKQQQAVGHSVDVVLTISPALLADEERHGLTFS